jgi:hypothetical protein
MPAPALVSEIIADLDAEDRERLCQTLNLPPPVTDNALAEALVPFAQAALAEYIDQMTGRQLPGRMRDFEQLRLLYMARWVFGGQLPDPDRVGGLFQKSSNEAKTLVRNTSTRYRHDLSKAMNDAAWNVLVTRSQGAGEDIWNVEVRDLALVEHMQEAVRRGPGNPLGIQKSKDEMHVYSIDKATMTALLASIGRDLASFLAALE